MVQYPDLASALRANATNLLQINDTAEAVCPQLSRLCAHCNNGLQGHYLGFFRGYNTDVVDINMRPVRFCASRNPALIG